MYAALRPSEIIREQKSIIEDQERLIQLLKGALSAGGLDDPPAIQPWMTGLTPQERTLLGALFRRYPNPVDKYALLELLPGWDRALDRQCQLVAVNVSRVRKKLGPEAIENIRGVGYRLSRSYYEAMKLGGAAVGDKA